MRHVSTGTEFSDASPTLYSSTHKYSEAEVTEEEGDEEVEVIVNIVLPTPTHNGSRAPSEDQTVPEGLSFGVLRLP